MMHRKSEPVDSKTPIVPADRPLSVVAPIETKAVTGVNLGEECFSLPLRDVDKPSSSSINDFSAGRNNQSSIVTTGAEPLPDSNPLEKPVRIGSNSEKTGVKKIFSDLYEVGENLLAELVGERSFSKIINSDRRLVKLFGQSGVNDFKSRDEYDKLLSDAMQKYGLDQKTAEQFLVEVIGKKNLDSAKESGKFEEMSEIGSVGIKNGFWLAARLAAVIATSAADAWRGGPRELGYKRIFGQARIVPIERDNDTSDIISAIQSLAQGGGQ